MDFLHCNGCGHVPVYCDQRRYFLTSCGHVFCESCSRRLQDICAVCQSNCRLVEVCSDSKNEIKAYFMDPIDFFKDSMKRVIQVMQFQRSQQKSFSAQFGKLMEAQKTMKAEQEVLKREVMMLKKKLESVQEREQNWIGNGVLRSPRGGGDGLFVQSVDPTLNSNFAPNPPSARRLGTPANNQTHFIFPSTSPVQRLEYAPGRLTLPNTPRRETSRMYSPGFSSNSGTPASSVGLARFSTPGISTTPDIVTRLKQLRCRANTPTPSGLRMCSSVQR